jgi:hypothetical protein
LLGGERRGPAAVGSPLGGGGEVALVEGPGLDEEEPLKTMRSCRGVGGASPTGHVLLPYPP